MDEFHFLDSQPAGWFCILTLFRTLTYSEASLSNNGARYVFNVLLKEASFAKAIRISTLPTRLSSLASGVSMLDMMVTGFVDFGHGKWKSFGLDEAEDDRWDEVLYRHPSQHLGQADDACALTLNVINVINVIL